MTEEQALAIKDLANFCNDVLEKLGWKWKPEIGEFYLTPDNEVRCIGDFADQENITYNTKKMKDPRKKHIPILPWEQIEGILEELGYRVQVTKWIESAEKLSGYIYECKIYMNKIHPASITLEVTGKSRQEAVMKAVIKLGERQV